jgi:2-keto-4-pentenoate hydratase/2-oxohepta-3-ene-1,7-dioic acid hydratase in catechol pathway
MPRWVRFAIDDSVHFGVLEETNISEHEGDQFGANVRTDRTFGVDEVTLLAPCMPSKIVALWNNFHALAEKQGNAIPTSPLYFIKPSSCVIGPEAAIEKPSSYDGKIFFEGELGIVIGKSCHLVEESEAASSIHGYTCVNDVTAMKLIHEDEDFQQWTRAKSFDTFGALGPCIADVEDPTTLSVKTLLNGRERQNYPISDMIIPPAQLVSLISQDMTLLPGDVIACGTSLGVLPMKPGTLVEVVIDGIGTLRNRYLDNTKSPG